MAEKYLHGYSTEEQERLVAQGQILAPFILERIDLQGIERLLEVGSGVGAMSLELLARYPDLRLTCLEIADTQLARARENLARANVLAQAELLQGDARQMPFGADAPFDAAFLCWILEHIPQPQAVLHELFRYLPLGATVFITEVFHSSFCLFPKCPNIEAYWRKAMEFQWNIGGNPDVGHRLGNMLYDAGFRTIEVQPYPMFFDKRQREKRKMMLEYWHGLMHSALDNMLTANFCSEALWHEAERELFGLLDEDETVFYYSFMQAKAVR